MYSVLSDFPVTGEVTSNIPFIILGVAAVVVAALIVFSIISKNGKNK